MAKNKAVILLFEDDNKIVDDFKSAIEPLLDKDLELEIFPLDQPPAENNLPYEDRVADAIERAQYRDRLTLIVTDRDLSTQSAHWRGLSESAVSAAAREFGIPVACYRRKKSDVSDDLMRIPGNGLIELPADITRRAEKVAILGRGFVDLAGRVQKLSEKAGKSAKKKGDDARESSPGALLAQVLEQPMSAAHFDTFACGDQTAIAQILRISGDSNKKISHEIQGRLVAALGVWLADVVMRYPGVLVNATAAASYLDIDKSVFKRESVLNVFSSARYGSLPFSDVKDPMWWRHLLDDIISDNGCSSGLDVCRKKGLKRLKYCGCSVAPELHAGYYCMATEQPISAEKSSGRVRWFPPGADLARLTQVTYKKLAPWIGT